LNKAFDSGLIRCAVGAIFAGWPKACLRHH
jgi:hypothetical protein